MSAELEEGSRQSPPGSRTLGAIAGRWRTQGQVIGEPSTAVVGSDVYELLPGGRFLLHHVDVTVGDRPVKAVEIIGEPANEGLAGTMLARSYDNNGAADVMRVHIDDSGVWHFSGGPEIARAARPDAVAPAEGSVRSTLRVGEDGNTMSAFWERTEDGTTWLPWMDIRFTRD
jgi:hypothetical protein